MTLLSVATAITTASLLLTSADVVRASTSPRADDDSAREPFSLLGTTESPVDVVSAAELQSQGFTTLPEALAQLVPSFVHPEPALVQGTDHVRPSALRGLAPDQIVVLVNGQRRHTASWLHLGNTYGQGSVGVDLGVLPMGAVERIEILRDGASARYGSGAIGGVINVVLKDATQGFSVSGTFGQYRTHLEGVPDYAQFVAESPSEFSLFERGDINTDDGDGDTMDLSVNGGFTLFEDGYLNLTGQFRQQDASNRSGYDDRRLYPDLPNGDWDPREEFADRRTASYGNPEQGDVNLLANFAMPVGGGSDFYGFIGYSARNVDSAEPPVLPRDSGNLPGIYPDGYRPVLKSDDENRYFTFGFRGEDWGWGWDLSYGQDEYEMDFSLIDSLNPSLGEISPTSFSVGNYEGRHRTFALTVGRDLEIGLTGPLALSMGLESRDAEYENEMGERASFVARGALDDAGMFRPPGSQGLFGLRPEDDFDAPLKNRAAWIQGLLPISGTVDAELGLRYDDEEAISALSGKAALHWRATDTLTLRGTVSRDFRSPSAAQVYFRASELVASGTTYRERGTYHADHPVALALGATPLDKEESLNVSVGFAWRPLPHGALSIDVYRIEVDDRVVLSDWLEGDLVDQALAGQGLASVRAARYLFNGVDTRTQGLDLAASYLWQGWPAPIEFQAGLNLTDTDVTGDDSEGGVSGIDRFAPRSQEQIESWTPDSKLHLGATWRNERLEVAGRLIRYGKVTEIADQPMLDQRLDPEWLINLDLRYHLTASAHVGFGVHNLFDAYPDPRDREVAIEAGEPARNRLLPYSNYAPFGFEGRFVYLRAGINLGG